MRTFAFEPSALGFVLANIRMGPASAASQNTGWTPAASDQLPPNPLTTRMGFGGPPPPAATAWNGKSCKGQQLPKVCGCETCSWRSSTALPSRALLPALSKKLPPQKHCSHTWGLPGPHLYNSWSPNCTALSHPMLTWNISLMYCHLVEHQLLKAL